jgi:hypothetical protein
MLENVSVDVWFVFGSFVYGFEGRVVACDSQQIEVQLSFSDVDAVPGLVSFLDILAAGAKGLLKSQISLFAEGSLPGGFEALRIFTEMSPVVRSSPLLGRLVFSGLCGVTPHDNVLWQKLVAG